jgi:hypothetical protein
MVFSADKFLDLACKWAYDHRTLLVPDDQFLPIVKSCGAADSDIHRTKTELEGSGSIVNHRIVTGPSDFTISMKAFSQYVRKTIPVARLSRARELRDAHLRGGKPFTSTLLARELEVSELEGSYILTALAQ